MAGITGTKALLEGLGKRRNRGGIAHNGYPSYLEAFVCNGKAAKSGMGMGISGGMLTT